MALQSDGKVLIGGEFTSYDGNPCRNFARINTDGSFDNTFNIGSGTNSTVNTIAVKSDGKILIGGAFWTYDDVGTYLFLRD
jgi:hypothetical protein